MHIVLQGSSAVACPMFPDHWFLRHIYACNGFINSHSRSRLHTTPSKLHIQEEIKIKVYLHFVDALQFKDV
jgi:hypothetical protein